MEQTRHRDLCKNVGIRPAKVVLEFAEVVKTKGLVPSAWIPKMVEEKITPAPVTEAPMVYRPKPRAKKIPGIAPDVVMGDRGYSDEGSEPVLAALPKRGVPLVGPFEQDPKLRRRKKTESAKAGTSKRDLQDSPSREDSSSKRPRTGASSSKGKTAELLDLSWLSVKELDPVTDDQVPGASDMVRTLMIRREYRSSSHLSGLR
jgi:hypothetical protein